MKLLQKRVRDPQDLNAAKAEFTAWASARGYVIVGVVRAQWQGNLFDGLDAYVEAEAKKK